MTLHILGAGSIGLLYASYMRLVSSKKLPIRLLLQRHHEAKVYDYKDYRLSSGRYDTVSNSSMTKVASSLDEDTGKFVWVQLKDTQGNTHTLDIPCDILNDRKDITGYQDISNVLLTTKAPQAVRALESVFPRFRNHVNVVVMTNGSLAVVDEIKSSLKRNMMENNVKIIHACSTHGAIRDRQDLRLNSDMNENTYAFGVTHTGSGQTFLEGGNGYDTESNNSLQQELNDIWMKSPLNPSIISSENMHVINWKKLAANCAINPLTALRHCRNGDLLSNKVERLSFEDTAEVTDLNYHSSALFYRIIREVSDVALVEMEKIGMSEEQKNELCYGTLVDFVEKVVCQTAQNKSSMLQDVSMGTYPTEIQYLNGFISRLGCSIPGVKVQANTYVTEEIERTTRPVDRGM